MGRRMGAPPIQGLKGWMGYAVRGRKQQPLAWMTYITVSAAPPWHLGHAGVQDASVQERSAGEIRVIIVVRRPVGQQLGCLGYSNLRLPVEKELNFRGP